MTGYLSTNYKAGFALSTNGTTITIGKGECRDASDLIDFVSTGPVTKSFASTWTPTGSGGVPSGVVNATKTWYHVFVIMSSTGAINFGFDTSVTATNLLSASGFSYYRRVGSFFSSTTSATAITPFIQYGNQVMFTNVGVLDYNGNAQGLTSIKVNTPPGVAVQALLGCCLTKASNTGTLGVTVGFAQSVSTLGAYSASISTSTPGNSDRQTVEVLANVNPSTGTVQATGILASGTITGNLTVFTKGYVEIVDSLVIAELVTGLANLYEEVGSLSSLTTPATNSIVDSINSVQDEVNNIIANGLPLQSGHAGQFLTTDGLSASWASTNCLPLTGGTITGNLEVNGLLNLDGNQISNLLDGSLDNDAANVGQVKAIINDGAPSSTTTTLSASAITTSIASLETQVNQNTADITTLEGEVGGLINDSSTSTSTTWSSSKISTNETALQNQIGTLSSLTTPVTTDLVAAVNSVETQVNQNTADITTLEGEVGGLINDSSTSTSTTWSSSKIGNTYLPLAGGSISGSINVGGSIQIGGSASIAGSLNMSSSKITNLANGTVATDAATFGQLPVANSVASNIKMDGAQSAGSLATFARADHVHPSDTSKISTSLLTSEGDLIVGGGGGTPSRLALGASGSVLTSNGTTAAWANPTAPSMAFTQLTDVPSSYSDSANKVVVVNPSATGLIFSGKCTSPISLFVVSNGNTFSVGTGYTVIQNSGSFILSSGTYGSPVPSTYFNFDPTTGVVSILLAGTYTISVIASYQFIGGNPNLGSYLGIESSVDGVTWVKGHSLFTLTSATIRQQSWSSIVTISSAVYMRFKVKTTNATGTVFLADISDDGYVTRAFEVSIGCLASS